MERESIFEKILATGIAEQQRAFKSNLLNDIRFQVQDIFGKTQDPALIYKELLELLDRYELDNYATRKYTL